MYNWWRKNNHYVFTTKEAKELITKIKELKQQNSNLNF